MKPAIFHLANLNLTVTISPDARRWVQEHIVSLETYAWAQADVFKRGGDVDNGVHVEFIEKPHMTPEDSMCPFERAAAIVEKLREQGELDPSKRPTEKIVREIACGEEWPKWRWDATKTYIARLDSGIKGAIFFGSDRAQWPISDTHTIAGWLKSHPCLPTEAAQWLRANGHAAEADRIRRERGEEFEPIGTVPVVGDRVKAVAGCGLDQRFVYSIGGNIQPDEFGRGPQYDWYELADVEGHHNGCRALAAWFEGRQFGGQLRILKRERGTELRGARVFLDKSTGWARVQVAHERGYWNPPHDKGNWRPCEGVVEAIFGWRDIEITNTPEAAAILADPALLALVGKGEA